MSLKTLNPRLGVLLLFIVAAGIIRIMNGGHVTPYSNIMPVGAMALFGGAYFADKAKAYGFPLLTLFFADIIIMRMFYPEYAQGLLYAGWIWTYLGYGAGVLIGQLLIKKVKVVNIVLASVAAAVAHWLLADFGTWLTATDVTTGVPFTKDAAGLIKCYLLGLPYLKNTLMGNLIYSGLLFGGFELMKSRFPVLAKV